MIVALGILIELLATAFIIYKVYQLRKVFRSGKNENHDDYDALYLAVRQIIPFERMSRIIHTEIAMLYYASFGWFIKEESLSGCRSFTIHKKAGLVAVLTTFLCLIALETSLLHIVLIHWSRGLALVVTLLSIYGGLFIAGMMNAVRKRPIVVCNDTLKLRIGLKWNGTAKLADIESVSIGRSLPAGETLRGTILGASNCLLTFKAPIKIYGIYGMCRSVNSISLNMDDPDGLKKHIGELKQ
jgi:hypothetical protein